MGRPEASEGIPLEPAEEGYFAALVEEAGAGTLYRFRLDDEEPLRPDPASRFQPAGPHAPSQVIDPATFDWSDAEWRGIGRRGQIIYELHVGTFTLEGTWAAAMEQLPALADLGITALEIMPVHEFPGRFGWGYDGVDLFAPTRLYGPPDDLRRFVDRAHAMGLGVLLDVVYNHVGPDGNYLRDFSDAYFTDRYENEWGDAINFDGDDAGPVREFFVANAGYWIDEFHLDGLRFDATQSIHDASPTHILAEMARRVREVAGSRSVFLVAENEPQLARIVRPPERGGYGLDALWNDDLHHAALVAVTGRREGYYTDYLGSPRELVAAAKWGYLYQGQWYRWQRQRRGAPALDLGPSRFVGYLQNHDQIANSARGARLHELTSPGRARAAAAMLLLGPWTPMLFMGEEFAASSPFLFFADHAPALADKVREGRAKFLTQFPSLATPEVQARLADPSDLLTFARCKLVLDERREHADTYRLYRDLIGLRRSDPLLRDVRRGGVDAAVLGDAVFLVRYFAANGEDRMVLVNLGELWRPEVVPEPLLAPPEGRRWVLLLSTEDPAYGGSGTPPVDEDGAWWLPAESAVLLAASVTA